MKKVLLLFSVLLAGTAFGQKLALSYHQVSIEGTSSLHDWESNVTKVTSTGTAILENGAFAGIKDLTVTIPVKSILSGKDVMDEKTWEAFNEPKNPNITFKANKSTIQGKKILLEGTLTMNGTTLPVKITCNLDPDGKKINLNGAYELDMTTYKMAPPKAMMGTIKVGPKVKVKFNVTYLLQS